MRDFFVFGTALVVLTGCFQERSFPLRLDEVQILGQGGRESISGTTSTRAWLAAAHERLGHLLPADEHGALLTEEMVDGSGAARDVFAHFERDPRSLAQVIPNLPAYLHTAQAVSSGDSIDAPPRPWAGFAKVWVPVAKEVELCAFLGLAKEGDRIREADCIVVLAGMLGDTKTMRTRDLSVGLRDAGFHVLALEMRGQGQTEAKFPQVPHNYGVLETVDLLKLSEWLTRRPHIRRTGLIGFSWGANMVLLTSWLDGCGMVDPSIPATVSQHFEPVSTQQHYSAGIMAFSPVLDWETLKDEVDRPISFWENPTRSFLQNTVRSRMKRKGYSPVNGSLRQLINHDFAHSVFTADFPVEDAFRFFRLHPYKGSVPGDKLGAARNPTLIVHGANDPMASAQTIADLIATTSNPNVAAIILPGGGHVGFAPYADSYFYSLIVNFFGREPDAGVVQSADAGSRPVQ